MSKSYDKINGQKVREQYFRSERRDSKRKRQTTLREQLSEAFDKAVHEFGYYNLAKSLVGKDD